MFLLFSVRLSLSVSASVSVFLLVCVYLSVLCYMGLVALNKRYLIHSFIHSTLDTALKKSTVCHEDTGRCHCCYSCSYCYSTARPVL